MKDNVNYTYSDFLACTLISVWTLVRRQQSNFSDLTIDSIIVASTDND